MRPGTGSARSAMFSDCRPGATAFLPRRIDSVVPGWSAGPDLRCAIAHGRISRFRVRSPRPRPRNHVRNWAAVHYSATVGMQQPQSMLGELWIMRVVVAIIGLLALGGCAGDVSTIDQPSMYISMANGGAKLDPQAAASMISLYRQNNGLGGVAVGSELIKRAESPSQSMASLHKLHPDLQA